MSFMQAKDTISGQEAYAYITIDGSNKPMFYAKKLTATVKKNKIAVKTLGKRGTQYKTSGWDGSGTMQIYYATSLFRELMSEYIENGIDKSFDIQVMNNDPTSSLGSQTVILRNVNLDTVDMAAFDVSADVLSENIKFTFEGVSITDSFNEI